MDTWTINTVNCIVNCPSFDFCVNTAVQEFTTVSEFENNGGSVSFPCNVSNSNISLTSNISDGNSCPEIITYSYDIWDDCLNYATCIVIYTVDDKIDPLITCPPDITLNCEMSIDTLITGSPLVSDNCGIDSLSYTDNFTLSCGKS